MSEATTTEIVTETAMAAYQAAQRKKIGGSGVRSMTGFLKRSEIVADHNTNIRMSQGQTVGGVEVTKDSRNIPEMLQVIREYHGLPQPLVISRRGDGQNILLGGFRRIGAVDLQIALEPTSALSVQLANELPCVIWEGLTAEQEHELMNDQRSKLYTKSEVLREFDRQLSGMVPWAVAAKSMFNQIARVLGSTREAEKIDQLPTEAEKTQAIKDWLQTSCQQFWETALRKMGGKVRDMMFQTYLFEDGMTTARPVFMLTQPRVKKLWAARNKDLKAGNWNAEAFSGPEYTKVWDEFIKADAIKAGVLPKEAEPFRLKFKTSADIILALQSFDKMQGVESSPENAGKGSLCGRVLRCVEADTGDPSAITEVTQYERCKSIFNQNANFLPVGLRSLLEPIFHGTVGSNDKFLAILAENFVHQTPVQEIGENPVNPTAVETTPIEPTPIEPTEVVSEGTIPEQVTETVSTPETVPATRRKRK